MSMEDLARSAVAEKREFLVYESERRVATFAPSPDGGWAVWIDAGGCHVTAYLTDIEVEAQPGGRTGSERLVRIGGPIDGRGSQHVNVYVVEGDLSFDVQAVVMEGTA